MSDVERSSIETPFTPPATLHRAGIIALQSGRATEAIASLAAAVEAAPERTDYRNDLGEALRLAGQLDAAASVFLAILEHEPGHRAAANNLGIVRHSQGRLAEACALYRQVIDADPNDVNALTNLGVALQSLGQVAEARVALTTARRVAPNNAAVALNLGNLELGDLAPEAAEALYREALSLDPGSAAAQVNLGRALKEQGRIAEALSACVRAKTMDPALPAAHWNEGLCRLLLGDFTRGWQGFAWRWAADAVPPHGIILPEWRGEPLSGRRLLVHAEQGLGDTFQFIRFVSRLPALGPETLTVLVQPALVGFLSSIPGIGEAVGPDAVPPSCDLRVPLLDLPGRLKLGMSDLAQGVPYLTADPVKAARWRERLPETGRRRVGLVWKGRPGHANDRNRSMPLAELAPLLKVSDIAWFSLQIDATPEERRWLTEGGVVSLADAIGDMEDTAAAIEALDLVVTVDTSVAHLAGALGKPVWILLPAVPDWRWLLGRSDSPWYPSARLFRQSSRGDWAGVITAVAAALRADQKR